MTRKMYKYITTDLTKTAFRPISPGNIGAAAALGGASGWLHSEGRPIPATAAGVGGGLVGAVPGVLVGQNMGNLLGHASPRARMLGAAIGGTVGALGGGQIGGRISDSVTGILPDRRDRASSRIAAWLEDRQQRLGSVLGPRG